MFVSILKILYIKDILQVFTLYIYILGISRDIWCLWDILNLYRNLIKFYRFEQCLAAHDDFVTRAELEKEPKRSCDGQRY